MTSPIRVTHPEVVGPLPVAETDYPFSTMRLTREPLDLSKYGYIEEEYLLSGTANVYDEIDGQARIVHEPQPYCTRVLVRRPATTSSRVAWLSILNASQGYDIEDDWRRAWDFIIGRGDTYVGVSSKPIQASALQTFDPQRYRDLRWGGPVPAIEAAPGWNPFMTIDGCEEGLVWDVLAQTAEWLRGGHSFSAPERVFMIGQSQSAVYTNTYLTYFHELLRGRDGSRLFDGYLPGVGTVFCKALNQGSVARSSGLSIDAPGSGGAQQAFTPLLIEPVDLDVPVITVSSEADTRLFSGTPASFNLGDGPMRRHWHVARGQHSDARSRVIPHDDEVRKSGRLPRVMDQAFLEGLSVLPLEPIITAAMAAALDWVDEGRPAAPSVWFETRNGHFVRDEAGNLRGGITLGMLAEPLAEFHAGSPENAVYGSMTLLNADAALSHYPSEAAYHAACAAIDDSLEQQGYLEPCGRALLRRVQSELWHRVVDGTPAPVSTPQLP